jgi:hypothetical protein
LVASARSQWPRASQSGLMHCTVKPGMYCIECPPWPSCSAVALGRWTGGTPPGGRDRNAGADFAVEGLWCQEKRLQDIVVWLRKGM